MIDDPEYDLRWTEEADAPYLIKWLTTSSRWFPFTNEKEMEPFSKNWIGFHRFKCSLTPVYKNKPIGVGTLFLMPYRKVCHHCLLYFIIAPEHRKKGVGASLLKNLSHLAKTRFRLEYIHAEVYEGCPAIPLLKKMGYNEVFSQKHFVKEKDDYLTRHVLEVKL